MGANWRRRSAVRNIAVLLAVFALGMVGCGSDSVTAEQPSGSSESPDVVEPDPDGEAASSVTPGDDAVADIDMTPATVRLGTPPAYFPSMVIHLAINQGYFGDENLTVEVTESGDPAAQARALVGGSFEFVATGPALVQAAGSGADIKVVASILDLVPHSVIARGGTTELADLRGGTWSTDGPGGAQELYTSVLDPEAGLGKEDLEFVTQGGSSTRVVAIQEGQADVTGVADPLQFIAEADGAAVLGPIVEYFKPDFRRMSTLMLGTPSAYAAEHPDVVARFVRALQRSVDFIRDAANEADVVEIGADVSGVDAQLMARSYDYWSESDYWDLFFPPDLAVDPNDAIVAVARAQVESGQLEVMPDVDEFVTNEFVERARAASSSPS